MLDDPHAARLIRCTALVGRQRRVVERLRDGGDPRTLSNAEQLLRSFERCLLILLALCRRRKRRAEARDDATAEADGRLYQPRRDAPWPARAAAQIAAE